MLQPMTRARTMECRTMELTSRPGETRISVRAPMDGPADSRPQ